MKTTLQPRWRRLSKAERVALADVTKRALERARKHKWRPTLGPWGHWMVPSAHEPGLARTVRVEVGPRDLLWFTCTCPSGFFRDYMPLSCWHAAAVGKALVNGGWAWWTNEGCFRLRKASDQLLDSTGTPLRIPAFREHLPGQDPEDGS